MKTHMGRASASQWTTDLLERDHRLRHTVFVDLRDQKAMHRSDDRDIDVFVPADATHLLLTDGDELVGGSRLTPRYKPNLLQTVFSGLVQGDFAASPSHGADWTHFYVRPDRREGWHRGPESAAFFYAIMEVAKRAPAPPDRRLAH
jgi:acyl-homoserine lactone synthase